MTKKELLIEKPTDQIIKKIKETGISNFIKELPESTKEQIRKHALANKVIKHEEANISKQLINQSEVINSYVNVLNERNKKAFENGLKNYELWLKANDLKFLSATRITALKYQTWLLKGRKLKINSCRKYLFVVKRLYDEFVLRETIKSNPFEKLPKLKAEWKPRPTGEYEPVNIELIVKLAIKNGYKKLARAVLVAVNYGLRWSELPTFEVNGKFVRWVGKSGKTRQATLTDTKKQELMITNNNTYFKSYWSDQLPNMYTLRGQWNQVVKTLKLKWTPHDLRHYFARKLYEKTKDILMVKKALGHSSLTTTDIYLNRDY